MLFPEKLAALCGIHAENYPAIYENMLEYLRGWLFGIPALVFVQLLGPLVVMDNGKKRVAFAATAVAARSVQNDLNVFMFALGPGIGKVLVTMTGMYYSAGDRRGLTRLFSYSMKFSSVLSASIGALTFLFAPGIVRLFTREPGVLEYAVLSVRCMAVSLVFDTVSCSLQNYLQGIRNLKLVNLMNFGERFFIPVATAAILGRLYGSKGVLVSMAVGNVVLAIMMLVIVCTRNRRLPGKASDFIFLPEDFGGRTEDSLYFRIESTQDVMDACRQTEEFCRSRSIVPVPVECKCMYK